MAKDSPSCSRLNELIDILKRYQPRYLVETPMPGFMEEHPLTNSCTKWPSDIRSGWSVSIEDADPRFVVFELDWRHAPGESG